MFFGGFEILFFLVFFLILGIIVFTIVRNIIGWNKNNHLPRLTVPALIVAKRTEVHHHHHADAGTGMGHTFHSSTYYVTFQVESGDRMELSVDGREYGALAEGDWGKLNFQGTRFLSFEREMNR